MSQIMRRLRRDGTRACLLFGLLVCSGAACFTSSGGGGSGGTKVAIDGKLFDSTGAPVVGAEIHLNGPAGEVIGITDGSGTFAVETRSSSSRVTLTALSPALSPAVLVVPIKKGVKAYTVQGTLMRLKSQSLTPNQPTQMPVPESPVAVGSASPQVVVPAVAASGLTLRVAPIDPSLAPGLLRAAGSDPGQALQSAGMFYIDIVDMNGQPAQPVPGMKIQIPPSTPPDIPQADAFMGWRLNEEGEWDEPKAAGKPDQGLTVEVTQFGFWNADRNFRTACVKGSVQTPSGACAGARVRGSGPDGISSLDSSGEDGGFCVTGAQTFPSQLSVGSRSMGSVQMPSNAGDCTRPETCTDLGSLPISEDDCLGASGTAQVGDPCASTAECTPGSVCYNAFCVGNGFLRVSLSWGALSDFDLHLQTPSGQEISYNNRSAGGGNLDVDQCISDNCSGSGSHVENIVFSQTASTGSYSVWVKNFSGSAAGPFTIDVAGAKELQFSGSLPATSGAESQHFSFQLP